MTKFTFLCFFTNKWFFLIKSKLMVSKSFWSQSAVGFLIRCILDYAQRHLVDFWKKSPANFNFIWLEWNSYNSSIQFHIVWSRIPIFKLKCSLDGGCLVLNLILLVCHNLFDHCGQSRQNLSTVSTHIVH